MTEMTVKESGGAMTPLDGLAKEAQYYSSTAINSLFQLGRVLCEAKKLVKHGEWGNWIRENAGCSERTAQQFMQAYGRFGAHADMAQISDRSKLFKMLALPEGKEQEFIEEHDLASMTAREVEQAVRKVKEDAEAQIQKERNLRIAAEARADELADRPPEIPQNIAEEMKTKDAEIAKYRGECQRIAGQAHDILTEKNALLRELRETEAMLQEQQEEYDRVQAELLNAQSMVAKGDTERAVDDRLTASEFTRAVGQFIGLVSRVPHMRRAFATMSCEEKDGFDSALAVVEEWAASARKAVDAVEVHMEEVVIHV